jgi:hypothetical protein
MIGINYFSFGFGIKKILHVIARAEPEAIQKKQSELLHFIRNDVQKASG